MSVQLKSVRNNFFFKVLNKVTAPLGKINSLKYSAEATYWFLRKLQEPNFGNQHFQYFFTEYFNVPLEFYQGKKILDIGCGPRGSLEWAKQAKERVGLDPLANIYKKMEGKKHQMAYKKGVSESISFPDNYFDVISAFNALDHVQILEKSIEEIIRVLKPKGYFLLIADIHPSPTLTEPNAFSWEIMDRLKNSFSVIQENHFEGHEMYRSIRKGVPFNHKNPKPRYGVLTAKLQKL